MAEESTKSSSRDKRRKPEKPSKDFPLFAHSNGQWAKKVRGKLHYFGPWADADSALTLWVEQKDDLLAGRAPRGNRDAATVEDVCKQYLASQERKFEAEELSRRTLVDNERVCKRIIKAFGRNRYADDLRPEDFGKFREELSQGERGKLSPLSLGIEIQRVKTVFNFAWENELIDRPIRYGSQFDKPSRKAIRKTRRRGVDRMFEAEEIRSMLESANPALKAMILLGVNGGFGNRDCAQLPQTAVDLDRGWIDFPRPKTGVERRFPLWPETVKALREAAESRPEPREGEPEESAGLFFLTHHGRAWVRDSDTENESWIDSVGSRFAVLLADLGLKKPGLSFYGLRHSFRTVADEVRDEPAVQVIMGHADDANDMGARYRARVGDDRLQEVVDHVRKWLFPPKAKRTRRARKPRKAAK